MYNLCVENNIWNGHSVVSRIVVATSVAIPDLAGPTFGQSQIWLNAYLAYVHKLL